MGNINAVEFDYDEGKYNGEADEDVPHGIGTLIKPNGRKYEGK